MESETVDTGQPNHDRGVFPGGIDCVLEAIVRSERFLAELVERFPLGGQAELPFPALNQTRSELSFECADRLADGGLRNAIELGGLGKTLGFGQITKGL
jgi:hypothetical protein